MSFPLPPLCGGDPYLTRIHLQELFDEYMAASHPTATVFSALVSNVRQPYLIELMSAKDALLAQHLVHARQISDLHAKYQREGAVVPVLSGPNDTVTPQDVLTSNPGIPARDKAHELLHESSILYVIRNPTVNRVLVSWSKVTGGSNWKWHLQLNVFRSKQPGTVRVSVVQDLIGKQIRCITGPANPPEAWSSTIEFWAYPRPTPGTRMISIVNSDESTGCIFVSEQDGEVDDWTSFFQIWLPV